MTPKNKSPKIKLIDQMIKDPKIRRAATRQSHLLFAHVYFAHYTYYQTARFQKELLALTENPSIKMLVVEAFRGSGKSTIMTLSLPLWVILGKRQIKFVVILAKTQQQARQYLANIKKEIETNDMLRADLGPFEEQEDEWRTSSIVIPKYGARITVASVDSSLRGIRHKEHRPGLVIADDLEDLESVRQQEQRDKLWQWYTGDVMPMGADTTQFIVIGTKLHEDSLLMRLRQSIESGKRSGIAKSYPLIDADGKTIWPGRFPTPEHLEELKRSIADEITLQREYMLNIIADENRVVRPEWIKYCKKMPDRDGNPDLQVTLTGIDLAISKENSADFTAMVSVSVFRDRNSNWAIYVHPNPVNEHLDYPETRKRIKELSLALGFGNPTPLHIESVGYQSSIVQDLRHDGFPAEEFKVHGQDKRMRLSLVTHLIKDGIVQFAERRNEMLINQLVGFGTERHDDLADAFAIALHKAMEMMTTPGIVFPRFLEPVILGPVETEEMRKIDERLADKALEWKQGRMSWPRWMAYQDEARDLKAGYHANFASRHHRGVDLLEKQEHDQLEEYERKGKRMLEIFRIKDS